MLLEEVKGYLKITWNDENSEIESLIERGKKYLSRLIGTSLIFEEDNLPKQLLLDYCRYAKNNALEFFEENFSSDILLLCLEEAIKDMEENPNA